MKKIFSLTLLAMLFAFASFATLGPITGSTSSCIGTVGYLTDSTSPGGTWSSSNTAIATVGLTSGNVYGVSAGSVTITYWLGGSYVTTGYTIYPAAPPAPTGASSFCVGSSSQLSDAVAGGTWTSGSTYIATVNPSTGMVYGVHPGTVYIYYSMGGSCSSIAVDTIQGSSAGTITGPNTVCAGSTITLTDSSSVSVTGTWSSSNSTIATVNPTTGVVYGATVGSVVITFTTGSGSCGPIYSTHTVNVINTTSPGTISGSTTVNAGATSPLYETVSGGTWSSSNPAVASINASTGVVTGVTVGSVVITYSVTGCGGTAIATYTVNVTAINGISGNIFFSGPSYYGSVKVWLITYNPLSSMLQAIDSLSLYCYGTSSVYYQFTGIATDSYRVKAAVYDSSTISTGYIPTYHTSSFYWYSANVINHTAGTADINENINMAYGTVAAGPGFIGGLVTAGANKGTTTELPVPGMNVNVFNSLGQLMESTKTDASGSYSFTNLPVGTYYVFPDSLNYLTTSYTGLVITAAAPSITAANFTQHTLSHTITPNNVGVNNLSNAVSSVIMFPNPSNGKLNLQWSETATEKGMVTVTDITGHEIYKSVINMNEGTGVTQIDLSGLANGLYLVSVKSGTINYNNKIQIQH